MEGRGRQQLRCKEVQMNRVDQRLDDPRAPTACNSDPRSAELAALVALAQAGDRAAFATLFHQFNVRICTYLARLVGDDDLGRDLAQDTFLAVWRALPEMRDTTRFTPWLYRIATNTARSHMRRARMVRWFPWDEFEPGNAELPFSTAGPEQHAGESELVALALARLAPQHRTCLLLQLEGGFSQREIAALLEISEKAVSAYVSRAREQFRRVYRQLQHESDRQASGKESGRE
jgi:RNA polymerase sigma-70 factor (ECF subfamily)